MLGVQEALVLFSEVVLSGYPLLIKLVDTSVFFQVGLRMAVFTGMAALSSLLTTVPLPAIGSLLTAETVAVGALNLVHVAGSYIGFEQLPGGNAMALFYTYPIFNILGAALAFGERIPISSLPWIALAAVGAVTLSAPTATNWTAMGVVGALIAAFTETGIYLWFKQQDAGDTATMTSETPWRKMIQMYGASGVFWIIGAVIAAALGWIGARTFRVGSGGMSSILLFNAIVGFGGYALRFFLIPRVSTVIFSALSFFGVISAYLLSWMFAGEVPSLTQMLGAIAIMVANGVLVTRENV